MVKYILLVSLAWAMSTQCIGQKKVAEVTLPGKPVYAAVDRPGDLYVVFQDALVIKYDKNGKQLGKRQLTGFATLFDPRDGIRAFAYHRAQQTTESIAPDLSQADAIPLHPEFAVSAWLVCPSKNEFWILDSADVSLKKTRDKGTAIAYEASFAKAQSDISQVAFMREYQNFLFVLDREKGIHVLNNLGREIRLFEEKAIPYFSFIGEEIYYPNNSGIQLIDLYTTDKRTIATPHLAAFTLLTDERMILITDSKLEFFEFKP